MGGKSNKGEDRGGRIVGGVILVALGVWFLLDNYGFDVPRMGQLWPLAPALGGTAFIITWLRGTDTDSGVLIPGVGGLLIGGFFFLFTMDFFRWDEMQRLWPALPLAGGLAFLAAWGGGRPRESGLLVPAGMGILVGVLGLLGTHGWLGWHWMRKGWPVALILFGILLMAGSLRPARRS